MTASRPPSSGSGRRKLVPDLRLYLWAHEDLNLGPLPCQGSALPLSYAPFAAPGDDRRTQSIAPRPPGTYAAPGNCEACALTVAGEPKGFTVHNFNTSPIAARPQSRPQQRAPVPRQSSTPKAGPSRPRANQARTLPPARPGSTNGSERAAESATSVPDGLRPHRRMAGKGTEAVALLIRGTGRATQPPARAPGACHPAGGRLAPGPSRLRSAADSHGEGADTPHGLPAPAAARPPRPGDPVREAAPGPHGCPRPRHLLRASGPVA
jgi:hypothetical protein